MYFIVFVIFCVVCCIFCIAVPLPPGTNPFPVNNNNNNKLLPEYRATSLKAQWKVGVFLYSFSNLSARWEWVVNATPLPLYPRERDQILIIQEAGWARKISPLPGFDPRTVSLD